MATVVKDFKVKAGLIVEGTTAKVNNFDILTKSTADQNYIIGLIGGSATAAATPDTVVLRDANGSFAANVVTANLVGDVTGTVSNISNHSTDTLSEGTTNKYFTDQRALDATAAAYDPAGSAATAESNANSYTDGRETAITTAYQSYADQAELDAISSANSYTDGRETAITAAYQSYADTAEADAITAANSYTDGRETAITTAYQSYADTAEADAKSYTDSLIGDITVDGTGGNTVTDRIATAVANLVDTAPTTLDTLNELAAALGDDPNFATTVSTEIGTKVSKAGDTMTGALTLSGAPTLDLHAATKAYVDSAAATAESNANSYTDGRETAITTAYQSYADTAEADAITAANLYTDGRETAITTAYQSYADTAEADAITSANSYTDTQIGTVNGTIAALTTTAISEGTNQYFTDERAQDAIAAAIAAGTQTNISVTYDDVNNSFSFVAENGVADSTTDDLTEGTTNLYFTDARAVSALEAVVPNFTEVDINSVATQVAATQTVATASQVVAYSFASTSYRSAKFIVKVKDGTHSEVSEVLVTLDSSDNIAITEYAVVGTNGSMSTISAGMNGTSVELLVTTANNNSDVTVMGTLLV